MDFHYDTDGQMIHNEGCGRAIGYFKDDDSGGFVCACGKQWDTEENELLNESAAEEGSRKSTHNMELVHTINASTGRIVECHDEACPGFVAPLKSAEPMRTFSPEPTNKRHVYRQCGDEQCHAYRLDMPHSHYEETPPPIGETHKAMNRIRTQLENFSGAIYLSDTRTANRDINSKIEAWHSVPADKLMQLVGNYITWIETGMTRDVCKCEWIEHPNQPAVRSGDTALDCPAHSKEGLVLGFFTWLKTNG